MALFKRLRWVVLVCVLTGFSAPLSAHVLNETTAQVILRDGQVEVRVTTGIDHLVSALQNDQAWLLGDIDAVMPDNLSASEQEAFIKNALQQKTRLIVNQQVVSFEQVSLTKNALTHSSEIVFQAKHTFPEVTDLSIAFHKILGPVHASFVKPQYKLLSAGESANVAFKWWKQAYWKAIFGKPALYWLAWYQHLKPESLWS